MTVFLCWSTEIPSGTNCKNFYAFFCKVKGQQIDHEILQLDEDLTKFCSERDFVFCGTPCQQIRELNRHVFSIVGPHGVGKTTLVHRLCSMIRCSSALNEVVRDIPFYDEIHDRQSLRATKWIYFEHLRRLMEILYANKDADNHVVICDRSEYDGFLYHLKGKGDFVNAIEILKKLTQNEQITKPYNHHIILFDDDMSVDSLEDKFRKTNHSFFAKKRLLFYKFFTVAFNDVLIVTRDTPINEIIDWMQTKMPNLLIS